MTFVQVCFLLCFYLCIATDSSSNADSSTDDNTRVTDHGRIVQSLFRFPAAQLGPEFNELIQLWYTDWLVILSNQTAATLSDQITPDESAKQHAANAVSATVPTLFRRQCYGPLSSSQQTLYKNLEQRRKEIEFQYLQDAGEEMKLLHTMMKRFAPAFHLNEGGPSHAKTVASHIHKKKARSTVNTVYSLSSSDLAVYDSPAKLAYQTDSSTQQWTWRPAGHFSARGTPANYEFRVNFFNRMREKLKGVNFDMGRQSGMFWYPPGSVREWHSNYLELVGNTKKNQNANNPRDEEIFASQVWRMYFVRTVRDGEFDARLRKLRSKTAGVEAATDESANDHSAMHIIPGDDDGITVEVLKNAGARLLKRNEKNRQFADEFAEDEAPRHGAANSASNATNDTFDRGVVWRIPDQDGYITLFRLPKLWHCIVSEEVHRYSLGFAFSDREAQELLTLAGVKFDVEGRVNCKSGECSAADEL